MLEQELSHKIYDVLTSRRFRCGPRPDKRKDKIAGQIGNRKEGDPVEVLLGWGGYKNPNLKVDCADIAEEATLGQLSRLNEAVKDVYPPGINVHIVLSGKRAERVNRMPPERTLAYQKSLEMLLECCNYPFIDIIPISELYDEFSLEFEPKLAEVNERLAGILPIESSFGTLLEHAMGNVYLDEKDMTERDALCRKAAIDYVVFKVAEDEARIYRGFSQSVKSAFAYPAMGHARYVEGELVPPRDSHISLYTTSKGVIVQPWQAIGVSEGGRVICLTKKRIAYLIQ